MPCTNNRAFMKFQQQTLHQEESSSSSPAHYWEHGLQLESISNNLGRCC